MGGPTHHQGILNPQLIQIAHMKNVSPILPPDYLSLTGTNGLRSQYRNFATNALTNRKMGQNIQLVQNQINQMKYFRSQYSGTMNALNTNDSLTDEKMKKTVNELVNVGISESIDVGKAAEVFYKDPTKVKVLFALPSEMRRSYVHGLLHPQKKSADHVSGAYYV